MARHVFPESRVHPAAQKAIDRNFRDTVEEVMKAVAEHDVVVVGMAINPHPGRAVGYLNAASIPHHYMGYGSYLSDWRRRTALKMWTGWPTFPMVFVKGTFVGGASDLKRLLDAGELATMLKEPRPA